MKKRVYIFILCLFFLPGVLYVTILLFNRHHTYNRTFEATVGRIGWQVTFREQDADSTLMLTFTKQGKKLCDSLSLLTHNTFCGNVVSFIFIEDVDTLFIRKNPEFHELFPPDEQKQNFVVPKEFVVYNPVIGNIPPRCQYIPFSDSIYFLYDKNKCTYIPKSNIIHVVTLFHDMERKNTYYLSDMTNNDTINVHITCLE